MIAGDVIHFSNSLYSPLKAFYLIQWVRSSSKKEYGWILREKPGFLKSDMRLKDAEPAFWFIGGYLDSFPLVSAEWL